MVAREMLGWLLLALMCLTLGCAQGFNRGAIAERLASQQQDVNDQDIKAAIAAKPQVKFPFKLAVELRDSSYCYQGCVKWTEADKAKIIAWGGPLKQAGVLSDFFLITDVFPVSEESKNQLKEVRLAAAQRGADAVLVIQAASDTDRYLNVASLLYITIVGFWMVPGSDSDALVVVRGGVWDVGNAYLYATAESEGQSHSIGPALLLEDRDSIEEAKQKALDSFGPELVKQLESLRAAPHK